MVSRSVRMYLAARRAFLAHELEVNPSTVSTSMSASDCQVGNLSKQCSLTRCAPPGAAAHARFAPIQRGEYQTAPGASNRRSAVDAVARCSPGARHFCNNDRPLVRTIRWLLFCSIHSVVPTRIFVTWLNQPAVCTPGIVQRSRHQPSWLTFGNTIGNWTPEPTPPPPVLAAAL